MSSGNHSNEPAGLNRPYEENEIRLKGIVGFAIGLVALIVITFALMWSLLGVLKDKAQEEAAGDKNPMGMSDRERLPPEPRLQLAPGFGVEAQSGRTNLELMPPSAEYRDLRKQWEVLWKHGQRDEKTGVTTMLPIEAAKQKFLTQNVKAQSGPDVEEFMKNARSFVSDSSSGRMASEKRR